MFLLAAVKFLLFSPTSSPTTPPKHRIALVMSTRPGYNFATKLYRSRRTGEERRTAATEPIPDYIRELLDPGGVGGRGEEGRGRKGGGGGKPYKVLLKVRANFSKRGGGRFPLFSDTHSHTGGLTLSISLSARYRLTLCHWFSDGSKQHWHTAGFPISTSKRGTTAARPPSTAPARRPGPTREGKLSTPPCLHVLCFFPFLKRLWVKKRLAWITQCIWMTGEANQFEC